MTLPPLVDDGLVFAANMFHLRNAREMSRAQLVSELNDLGWVVHQTTIVRIETGEQQVKLREAVKIATALGTDVSVLLQRHYGEGGSAATGRDATRVRYETTTGCSAAGITTVYGDVLDGDPTYLVIETDRGRTRVPHDRVIDITEDKT